MSHAVIQQPAYHPGQYQAAPGYQPQVMPVTPQHATPQQYPQQTPQMVAPGGQAPPPHSQGHAPGYATPMSTGQAEQVRENVVNFYWNTN